MKEFSTLMPRAYVSHVFGQSALLVVCMSYGINNKCSNATGQLGGVLSLAHHAIKRYEKENKTP